MRTPMTRRIDWLVAMDDLLTRRFTNCVFCSRPAEWAELRSTTSGYARTLAVCIRCKRSEGAEARLQALVEEHAQRWGG
jgi:hypothetical protein